jgi:hypothetical protein
MLADLQHLACLHAMPAAVSTAPARRLSGHLIDLSVLPFKSAQEAVRLMNPVRRGNDFAAAETASDKIPAATEDRLEPRRECN